MKRGRVWQYMIENPMLKIIDLKETILKNESMMLLMSEYMKYKSESKNLYDICMANKNFHKLYLEIYDFDFDLCKCITYKDLELACTEIFNGDRTEIC